MNKFGVHRQKEGFLNLFLEEKSLANRHSQSILQMIHEIKMINLQKREHSDVFRVLAGEQQRQSPELGKFASIDTDRVRRSEFLPAKDPPNARPIKVRRPHPIEIAEVTEEDSVYFLKTPRGADGKRPQSRNVQSNQEISKAAEESTLAKSEKKELKRTSRPMHGRKVTIRSRSETRIRLPTLNVLNTMGVAGLSRNSSARKLEK